MIQIHTNYHNQLHTTFRVLLVLAIIQIISSFTPAISSLTGIANYVPLHTFLEFLSIIVSTMIFVIVWNNNINNENNRNYLLLACSFLGVAILDLLHALSYPGMPDFISASSPEKAINFWLMARYISAFSLLLISLLSWHSTASLVTRRLILALVCIPIIALSVIGLFHPSLIPSTFIHGQGLTSFKIINEYCLIALYFGISVRFLYLMCTPQPYDIVNLFAAVCIMAMSELFFTLYSDVTDIYNLLGHAYKVIAYFFIYKSIFITNIKKPYEQLFESRNLLHSVIEAIPMRVFWKNTQSRYLGCNTLFAKDAGQDSPEDLINKFDDELVWHDQAASYKADDLLVMQTHASKMDYEEMQTTPSGELVWLRTSKAPLHSIDNKIIGMLGVYEDISRLKQAERIEQKLTRAHTLQSKCSSALIHADNEQMILDEICRLIVEVGGYLMAWVGFKEYDPESTVRPIAQYGCHQDYLDTIKVCWSDTPLGQGPTGKAIRTLSTVVNYNSSENKDLQPWRDTALKHSFHSSIAIPLISDNTVLGALSLYSNETEAFSADEIALLEEMANDLAYGIQSIRMRDEKKQIEDKIKHLAFHDVLTNLPNRTLFFDRFHQAISHSKRTKTLLAVCFLDLDNFKPINDNFGHETGDKLLIEVAKRLSSFIRAEDTVSRQGGDEFVLLLSDISSVESCKQFLDRLHQRLAEPFVVENHTFTVSASSGATLYPHDEADADTLLRHADNAMYQAKIMGKNCSYIFDISDNLKIINQHRQISQIEQALTNNELCLHYQPKVNMKTGVVFGVEALIRWQHPEKGLVPPIQFLPLITNSALEIQIGHWVLTQAVQQINNWSKQGIELEISVNIASYHLLSPQFIADLAAILKSYPIDTKLLQLELLESSALNDVDRIIDVIQRCQNEFGISFALDDFGTGYSSLTHVRNLPADTIKIDQHFVRDILDDPDDYAIIDSIIGLANSFRRDIIAEGVETTAQGLMLLTMGCNNAQGYSIAKPMPVDDFTIWLQNYIPNNEWLSFDGATELDIEHRIKRIEQFQLVSKLWFKIFKKALYTSPENEPTWPALDKNECHHGIWLNRLRQEQLFTTADIDIIDDAHSHMHDVANDVAEQYKYGHIEQARQGFSRVKAAYDNLNNQLNQWL